MDATGMRMKENKEFQASETDYLEAIDEAQNAVSMLGKHNPVFLSQNTLGVIISSTALMSVRQRYQQTMSC